MCAMCSPSRHCAGSISGSATGFMGALATGIIARLVMTLPGLLLICYIIG